MEHIDDYKSYFKDIADNRSDIKSFVYGDNEEILSLQRSELEYPVLWLETPDVSFSGDDDDTRINFRGSIVVLNNVTLDDWTEQQQILSDTFTTCKSILYDLIKEADEFDLELTNTRMDQVSQNNNDNDYGWRVEFNLVKSINPC